MSEQSVYIAEGSASSTSVPIDVIGRASPEIFSTLSAAVATTGATTIAVTSGTLFPQSGSFYVRIDTEEMLVTAGQGTGAVTFTVTRGVNGTTAATHLSGAVVSQLVGVQRVEPVHAKKNITYKGRAASFQVPGRAGTVGQKLSSIFNTSAAPNVVVDVQKILVDMNSTVAKTVANPILRVYKVTTAPTNGTSLSKVAEDSALTTSANVVLLQDASADTTSSATTLTSTLTVGTNVLTQVYPSQLYTAVGFAPFDAWKFFPGEEEYITLNAGEGLVVMLDYTASTQNPTTDRWSVDWRWYEYTNG